MNRNWYLKYITLVAAPQIATINQVTLFYYKQALAQKLWQGSAYLIKDD
jgi:hypothetical protein